MEKSMRIPSSVFAAGRKILGLLLVAGSIMMVSGQRRSSYSPRDIASVAPQAAVQYVNPGLFFNIVSAKITSAGVISVDYTASHNPDGIGTAGGDVMDPGPGRQAVRPHRLLRGDEQGRRAAGDLAALPGGVQSGADP